MYNVPSRRLTDADNSQAKWGTAGATEATSATMLWTLQQTALKLNAGFPLPSFIGVPVLRASRRDTGSCPVVSGTVTIYSIVIDNEDHPIQPNGDDTTRHHLHREKPTGHHQGKARHPRAIIQAHST